MPVYRDGTAGGSWDLGVGWKLGGRRGSVEVIALFVGDSDVGDGSRRPGAFFLGDGWAACVDERGAGGVARW